MDTQEQLAPKAELFVEHYFAANCNGSEAARRAGYSGDAPTLATQAWRLLRNADIRARIDERRKAIAMDALESVQRMSQMGRCTMDDCLDDNGRFDIVKARETGAIHLLKEVKVETANYQVGEEDFREVVKTTVKLHDAKDATKTMMQMHGLLKDKEQDGPGVTVNILNILQKLPEEQRRQVGQGVSALYSAMLEESEE